MGLNKPLAGAPPQDEEAVPPAGKSLLNDDQHGMAPDGSARNRKCACADCLNGKKPRREYLTLEQASQTDIYVMNLHAEACPQERVSAEGPSPRPEAFTGDGARQRQYVEQIGLTWAEFDDVDAADLQKQLAEEAEEAARRHHREDFDVSHL